MRKIKLMALLLAALMVVTAFAGCAGVKQEELDAVEDRVSAIEELLKGQQATLDKIADKDNKDILDAIESVKTDLEEKIESVNGRVDDIVENPAVGTTTPEDVKAKQAEALADIKVQEATFAKNAAEYDDDTYAAITAALATAQGAVSSATTEEAVKAAMDTLKATLDTYKTYAMKLYDYYVALLGNVNEDAEELVDEVVEFIEVLEEVYEDAADDEDLTIDEFLSKEMRYLVSEGTTAAKNVYLDVYKSVVGLCGIFNGADENYVEYVNAKGKVVDVTVCNLDDLMDTAEDIVDAIEDVFEDGITYEWIVENGISSEEDLETELETEVAVNGEDYALVEAYDEYVLLAELIGGKKLVDLVTNADVLVDAADKVSDLLNAAEAFEDLNGRNKDGLSEYAKLVGGEGDDAYDYTKVLTFKFEEDDDTIWAEEYYAEEIEAVIADWAEEYDLSAEDAAAIIEDAGYDYEQYLLDRRTVSLIAKAYETFTKDIVPAVKALNKLASKSVDAVEDFEAIIEMLEDLYILQEKDLKAEEKVDQKQITLDGAIFGQFIVESGILDITDLKLNAYEELEELDYTSKELAEEIQAISDERVAGFVALFSAEDALKEVTAAKLVEIFTFNTDKTKLEKNNGDYLTKRTTGEIYTFFKVEYAEAEAEAKLINLAIESLVEKVEKKKISDNKAFIDLAGEYITVSNAVATEIVPADWDKISDDKALKVTADGVYLWEEVEVEGEEPELGWVAADTVKYPISGIYVAVDDIIESYKELIEDEDEVRVDGVLTIEFFNAKYPTFKSLIDVEDFEDAKKTAETRIAGLFDDIDELAGLVDKIGYVRTENVTAYEFEDKNGDGKYNPDDKDVLLGKITDKIVSLSDKNDVDAAVAVYYKWENEGGNEGLKLFTETVNADSEDKTVYGGIYTMKGFEDGGEVRAVLNTLEGLNNKIAELVKDANAFIKAVEYVESLGKVSALSIATLDGKADDRNRYALTAYTPISGDAQAKSDVHGKYSYVVEYASGSLGVESDTFTSGNTSVTTAHAFLASQAKLNPLTKVELVEKTVALYDKFVKANVEYVPAVDNDYDEGDEDGNVYYTKSGYAAYKAVDDAKAKYDKYDLIVAKAACVNAFSAVADNVKTNNDKIFLERLKATSGDQNIATIEVLDNVIANYNTKANTSVTIDADDVKAWVIYEFDCLDYTPAPVVAE